ncbi:MAG: ATP synthase F1 subunit gamma [Saprospiraceae bacterium]|nr:ATP synthase F1 subunit gamma [Saprospiraceae bacterium]
MPGGLKEVRERIKSVINTQQITKAMKMVSAAKLRKAQSAIVQMRPYSERLNKLLSNILSNLEGDASTAFGQVRDAKKVVVVVVTSNRGLCGAFNTNICKEAIALINERYAGLRKSGGIKVVFIGKKGYDYFRRRILDVEFDTSNIGMFSDLSYDHVSGLSNKLMAEFTAGKIDAVHVVYGHFRNAAVQLPTVEHWLPVTKIQPKPGQKKEKRADYLFEPNKQDLLETLVPSILQLSFHKTLLDTHASEHGARMTAMDNASENANEILKELRINYNKARQEAITRELSEIVGGAAALEA